jgi:hypothetical protein
MIHLASVRHTVHVRHLPKLRRSRSVAARVVVTSMVIVLSLLCLLFFITQPLSVWGVGASSQPIGMLAAHGEPIDSNAPLSFTASFTAYLPIIRVPPLGLKQLVTHVTITLPLPLQAGQSSFCTWDWCTLSPRLYHEPLDDSRTLLGWTDASGNGHISIITGTTITQLAHFTSQSVRGLVAHADGSFAVLRWEVANKIMWISKHQANGVEIWKTNLNTTIAVPEFWLGDGRLTHGNGKYAAYFTVNGVAGVFDGHYGDQLSYVADNGVIQSGGWEWGCSHSMAQLISYHPQLSKFAPVCSSDCYSAKGILANDNQLLYHGDGDCGGMVSTQLGQLAVANQSWKLIFNALNRPPAAEGHGIGFATVDGDFHSNYIWLTNTSGDYERDPIMARLGTSLNSGRYLVGWATINDGAFMLGIIDDAGAFVKGPEEVTSAGLRWGNRTDTLRTRVDGTVSWVHGDANSTQLHLFRLDGSFYLP